LAFAVAAAVIVLLAFGAAFVVSWSKEGTLPRLQAGAPTVKRWGGVVLVILGGWFIATGVFAHAFARVFPVTPRS
jgi:hypothetical protein